MPKVTAQEEVPEAFPEAILKVFQVTQEALLHFHGEAVAIIQLPQEVIALHQNLFLSLGEVRAQKQHLQ